MVMRVCRLCDVTSLTHTRISSFWCLRTTTMALCCKHSAAVQEGAGEGRERAMAHPPPSPFSSCSRTHDASFRMGSARPLSRGGVTPLPTPFRALRRRPKGSLATGLATEHVAFPRSRLSCCQAREGEAPNKRAAALCSSLQEEPLWAMVNLDVCVRVHMFVCKCVSVRVCAHTHSPSSSSHAHTHTHLRVRPNSIRVVKPQAPELCYALHYGPSARTIS